MPGRKWTPEERKAASERAKARGFGRPQANVAVMAIPEAAKAAAEIPSLANDEDLLNVLADRVKAEAQQREKRRLLLEQLDEHPELADDLEIAAMLDRLGVAHPKRKTKGLRPGTRPLVRDDKGNMVPALDSVDWTEADLTNPEWGCVKEDGTPNYITFTPNETICVWYQGIRCQFIADQEITILRCFYDVYQEHKRLIKEAELRKAWMFGKTAIRPPSGGDSDMAMATVRAFMGMGGEGGGGRILTGYPGDARFELRDIPGGGETSGETVSQ